MLILPDLKVTEGAIQVAQKIVDNFRKLLLNLQELCTLVEEQVKAADSGGAEQGASKTEVKKPSLA